MPRISDVAAKKIALIMSEDIPPQFDHIQKNLVLLDRAYILIAIASQNLTYQRFAQYESDFEQLKTMSNGLNDETMALYIDILEVLYYFGLNHAPIDLNRGRELYDLILQKYQNMEFDNNWDKYQLETYVYFLKSLYAARFNLGFDEQLHQFDLARESAAKITDDIFYVKDGVEVNLANLYLGHGKFDSALEINDLLEKKKDMIAVFAIGNSAILLKLKGDLSLALAKVEKGIVLAQKLALGAQEAWNVTIKSSILFELGLYDESLKNYRLALELRQREGSPTRVFFGFFSLFNYFIQRFESSSDQEFLDEARLILLPLQELKVKNSDNKVILNYTCYAEARILRYGSMRKRVQAIEILEDLLEDNPNDIGMMTSLLQLYFDDFKMSADSELEPQIDDLFTKLSIMPLNKDPHSILLYVSQQILSAKYHFYLKGNPFHAINILDKAKDSLSEFSLPNLIDKIDLEASNLKKDIVQWENTDSTLKERIEQAGFSNYITEALNVVGNLSNKSI